MRGKLERTLDATFLNVVANFPGVRENLGGEGKLELAGVVADPRNFTFVNAYGGFIFLLRSPGMYEIHMICPSGHKAALAMGGLLSSALEFMFLETDALELSALCRESTPSVERFAKLFGFHWFGPGEQGEIFHLTLDDWFRRAKRPFEEGKRFAMLTSASSPHPFQLRAIGTALLLCHAGNAQKGLGFYSRLATLMGYSIPEVLTPFPLVLNIGGAAIALRNGSVEILRCQ